MKLPRCSNCGERIVWITVEWSGRRRPFELRPVDGRTHVGSAAYPVENGARAWRLRDLVEDLQARRECSHDAAETEAYDMPWHVLHDCPNAPEPVAPREQESRAWTG